MAEPEVPDPLAAPDPLTALTIILASFRRTQGLTLREFDRVPMYVCLRMSALGSDIVSAVEGLRAFYIAAQADIAAFREAFEKGELAARASDVDDGPARRATTAFKSVFIFVRAYQDAVCGFLHELQGQHAGPYTSMNNHLKPGRAVGAWIDEKFPEYREWFGRLKDDRDRIKVGAAFQLRFDGDNNLTLSFMEASGDRMVHRPREIGLHEVFDGLNMSGRLTALAFQELDPSEVIWVRWPAD